MEKYESNKTLVSPICVFGVVKFGLSSVLYDHSKNNLGIKPVLKKS